MNPAVFDFLNEEWFKREPSGSIDQETLFQLYSTWCKSEGLTPLRPDQFTRAVERTDVSLRREGDLVFGIRLNEIGERMMTSWELEVLRYCPERFLG